MIIVPIKEGENIERALKKFKRKFEKTGVMRELRSRQAFEKPSVIKREQKKKLFIFRRCNAKKRLNFSGNLSLSILPFSLLFRIFRERGKIFSWTI